MRLRGTASAADYVSFGPAPNLGTATFTVETWFRREGIGAIDQRQPSGTLAGLTAVVPLVTKGRNDADGDNRDINYFLGITGNVLAADFEEAATGPSPGTNHPLIGTTPIVNNQWYHGAVTYDGVTLQLYLNGVLEAAATIGRPARADNINHAAIGTAINWLGVAQGFFAGHGGRSADLELRSHGLPDRRRQGSRDRFRQRPPRTLGLRASAAWHRTRRVTTSTARCSARAGRGWVLRAPR